ncbi:hypothetical protein L0F63_005283, partial [Massospora cicadina]
MDDLVTNWSIDQVGAWLASKGFDSFRNIFKEEGNTGDVLIHLDHECLSEMHMSSVGKRVLFMKAVYELKVRHNLPIYPEDYQPPNAVIKHLVQEVSRLASEIGKIRDEIRWKPAEPYTNELHEVGGFCPLHKLNESPFLALGGPRKKCTRFAPLPQFTRSANELIMVHLVENVASGSSDINFGSDTVKVKEAKAQRENDAYKHFRISPEDP